MILRRHVMQGERDSFNQVSESHINYIMFEILKNAFFFNAKLDISKVDLKYGSPLSQTVCRANGKFRLKHELTIKKPLSFNEI